MIVGVSLTLSLVPVSVAWAVPGSLPAHGLRAGDRGSGVPRFPTRIPSSSESAGLTRRVLHPTTWSDVGPSYAWALPSIDWVARDNDWMADYAPRSDGTTPFHPARLETRAAFARSVMRALAPTEEPDPSIEFTDLAPSSPLFRSANVLVKLRWLTRSPNGAFRPDDPITMSMVHRALVRALGLTSTARQLDDLHTADGVRFPTPADFGTTLLGMRLGLRYNNQSQEWRDVNPRSAMNRAQVAYSLATATTLESWVVPYLVDQYHGIELPVLGPRVQKIVRWGVRYVGYPYVWGGEWGLTTPEPAALGGQQIPGFDCTGLTWWVLRKNDGAAWRVAPPRPYRGWSLPQRVSRDMARMAPRRITFGKLKPGDVMFYDGDGDGVVDHADTFIGDGWAIDSSSSIGGVTLMWVGTGWYHDHFTWGRRVLPRTTSTDSAP
jgi:cell wall-associated NlpC family hydrolase